MSHVVLCDVVHSSILGMLVTRQDGAVAGRTSMYVGLL